MKVHPPEERSNIIQELQKLFRFSEWTAKRGLETDCRCEYCDRDLLASFNDYDSWQIDHIYPSSKGGKDQYENMAVCCKTCNFLKRNYVPTGVTREEQIADARHYIQSKREMREAELGRIRILVRGFSA
jgi:5-methylcytosine-specific restriction endonuclease McrA